MAVTAFYNRIDKYKVQAKLRQPLHVGSAEKGTGEVLIHPVLGRPFVQASGIAGVFRACYEEIFDDLNMAQSLFGDNEKKAGRIRFTDGWFLEDQEKQKDGVQAENGCKSDGLKIELRPRIKIDPATGTSASSKGKGLDAASGQKFEMEYIGAGQIISFDVYIYSEIIKCGVKNDDANGSGGTDADSAENISMDNDGVKTVTKVDEAKDLKSEFGCDTAEQEMVEQVFAQIHGGQVQFGGQKSNGCGSMEIISLKHRAFDMTKEEDRQAWMAEDSLTPDYYQVGTEAAIGVQSDRADLINMADEHGYRERLNELKKMLEKNQYSTYAYQLILDAQTEGSLLVKAIALEVEEPKMLAKDEKARKDAGKDEKEPDYVNMRNTQGRYIIPGSSVKGAVRAQFERISDYLEKNTNGFSKSRVVADAFGREAKNNNTGSAGNVRFRDVLVGKIDGCKEEVVSNRIHIDRFTGGVMNTGLFKEQAVHGRLQIEAVVMKERRRKPEVKDDATQEDAKKDGYGQEESGKEKAGQNIRFEDCWEKDITEKADRSCGMLILSLRDLALGMYNLGSGYSIGRGFLRAESESESESLKIIRSDDKEAVIRFNQDSDSGKISMEVDDQEGIIGKCMKALASASDNETSGKAGREGA